MACASARCAAISSEPSVPTLSPVIDDPCHGSPCQILSSVRLLGTQAWKLQFEASARWNSPIAATVSSSSRHSDHISEVLRQATPFSCFRSASPRRTRRSPRAHPLVGCRHGARRFAGSTILAFAEADLQRTPLLQRRVILTPVRCPVTRCRKLWHPRRLRPQPRARNPAVITQ